MFKKNLQTANTYTQIIDIDDPRASQAEAALDAAGFPLPLPSRVSWGRHFGVSTHKLAIATDTDKQLVAAIGLELTQTRSLPGHYILSTHAFGDAYATKAGEVLLDEIIRYTTVNSRVLRIVVELECRDELARQFLHNALVSRHFYQIQPERIPAHTLIKDLTQNNEKIFASFSESTRHKIRKSIRSGLELDLLTDLVYATRMNKLLAATFARTGMRISDINWKPIIAICQEFPHRSHLVGIFHGSGRTPEDLLAFAWGIHHGERAVYRMGASSRDPGVKLPLLYLAFWDLIEWAKREGARWFDLGGIIPIAGEGDNALEGISRFKRGFSREEIALGEEWVYEPSAFKARIAGLTSNTAHRIRELLQRFQRRYSDER